MAGRKREPALRLFASEYNVSTLETKGEEEYSPSYLITPLGAMANRVYFIGVLTEKENKGSEIEPLYMARVKDPTGTFFLSAGSYQPEAAASLREIDPPSLVAVVGKIRTFENDEGQFYVSIRPERVTPVSKEHRDYWIYQAAVQTNQRLADYQKAIDLPELTEESVTAQVGLDVQTAQGIVQAVEHYGIVELHNFKEAVNEALSFIVSGKETISISEQLSQDDILDSGEEERPDEAMDALTSGEDAAGPDTPEEMEMDEVNVDDESDDSSDPQEQAPSDGEDDATDDSEEVSPDESTDSDEGEEEPGGSQPEESGEETPEDSEEEPPQETEAEATEEPEEVEEPAEEPEVEEEAQEEEPESEVDVEESEDSSGPPEQLPSEEPAAEIEEEKQPAEEAAADSDDDDATVGLEQRICEAIKELSAGPRGASYHEVQELLEKEGVTKTQFEESVNLLLDKGIIYEPSVNRINVVNY